jgi:hypothetical protein
MVMRSLPQFSSLTGDEALLAQTDTSLNIGAGPETSKSRTPGEREREVLHIRIVEVRSSMFQMVSANRG